MMKIAKKVLLFICLNNICMAQPLYTNKFENVLLIVNFNHPFYGNIEFLKKLYAPFFPRMVFYGEQAHPEVTVKHTTIGYHVSDILIDAITKNPDCDGYLFLEDDCILNMWRCEDLALDKIWLLPNFNNDALNDSYYIDFFTANLKSSQHNRYWMWWSIYWHSLKNAVARMLPRDVAILAHNVGNDTACGSSADMFYVPARYKDEFLRLADVFRHVFIEIAMPTILASLDYKENWEKVTVLWKSTNVNLEQRWPITYTCIHVLKLSSESSRVLVKNVFEKMMPGLHI